jgi:3-methyladenine DNA glycosylase Mpg
MNAETLKQLKRDMYVEARELLGAGYVAEYYEDAADGFIQIAEAYIREAETS